MRIDFHGRLSEEPVARVGFIGCGSHSFRNLYPCLQFCPTELVAVCDLDIDRARAFARQFGAERAYADHHEMLAKERLDGVLICTGYDSAGRPTYPQLAVDCMEAGCHVWMEKPPAASCAEIERMQEAAERAGKHAMVGLKKMFFPANEKAAELMRAREFGAVSYVSIQYPQRIPTVEEFAAYARGERGPAVGFLDPSPPGGADGLPARHGAHALLRAQRRRGGRGRLPLRFGRRGGAAAHARGVLEGGWSGR